jgi:hypothetical protein
MWSVKTEVIPVIIGATGTISKSFRKYQSHILGKHKTNEIHKKSNIGHCTQMLTLKTTNVSIEKKHYMYHKL